MNHNVSLSARPPAKKKRRKKGPAAAAADREPPPSFCNATASLVASSFAASRLEEIQALYHKVQQDDEDERTAAARGSVVTGSKSNNRMNRPPPPATNTVALDGRAYSSQACQTSARHLRRRTTSHNPPRRHRYPLGDFPPRPHSESQQEQHRSSHNNRNSVDTTRSGDEHDEKDAVHIEKPSPQGSTTKPSRRSRRFNRSWLISQHDQWKDPFYFQRYIQTRSSSMSLSETVKPTVEDENIDEKLATASISMVASSAAPEDQEDARKKIVETSPVSADQEEQHAFWIPTHLWHAKRFHMAHLWNWKVPLMHTNRGAKAALRLAREGKCLIQDLSWRMQPLCLVVASAQNTTTTTNSSSESAAATTTRNNQELHRNAIATALQRIIPRFENNSEQNWGQGMLYELDQSPLSAIGPVQWMILASPLSSSSTAEEDRPLVDSEYGDKEVAMDATANRVTDVQRPRTSYESSNNQNDDMSRQFVYLFVHPAILTSCYNCLQRLVDDQESLRCRLSSSSSVQSQLRWELHCGIYGGLDYFALRGPRSQDCLSQGLTALVGDHVQDKIQTFDETGVINALDLSTRLNGGENQTNAAVVRRIYTWSVRPREEASPWNHGVNGWDMMLVGQPPSNSGNSRNGGNSPTNSQIAASQVFLALVVHGGACPIGVVEESHLALECHPPIPEFPRDYPDTVEGKLYWTSTTATSRTTMTEGTNPKSTCNTKKGNKCKNVATLQDNTWTIVRRFYEGGLGRISVSHPSGHHHTTITSKAAAATIDWTKLIPAHLLSSSNAPETTSVVMMRGVFGKPLVDLMCSTDTHSSSDILETHGEQPVNAKDNRDGDDELGKKERRPRRRRPAKNPTDIVRVPVPSRRTCEQFRSNCLALLQSLSLPAILLARLRIEHGPGTLVAGTAIMSLSPPSPSSSENAGAPPSTVEATATPSTESDRMLLGYVTTGVFSHHRGRCHGLAVLGASRFLHALSMAHESKALARAAVELGKKGKNSPSPTRLLAQVRVEERWRLVSIALLL